MAVTPARREATDALLDAGEALLIELGYAGVTTRKLGERAGVNHGLVHYYFGSMEELFLQVLERFTARLTSRQREMYEADVPFIEKWRTAMRYLLQDRETGYQKVWLELQAMAWNHPEMQTRMRRIHREWEAVLVPAFDAGLRELGVDARRFPTRPVVSLVLTFNQGVMLEGLVGVDSGHAELIAMIDRLLVRLAREQRGRG